IRGKRIDGRDARFQFLDIAFVLGADKPGHHPVNHLVYFDHVSPFQPVSGLFDAPCLRFDAEGGAQPLPCSLLFWSTSSEILLYLSGADGRNLASGFWPIAFNSARAYKRISS